MNNKFIYLKFGLRIKRKDRWLCKEIYQPDWDLHIPCIEPNGDQIEGQSYTGVRGSFWKCFYAFLFAEIEPYRGIDAGKT